MPPTEPALLEILQGTWRNLPNLPERGLNLIALPFVEEFRLLINRYNEELTFTVVDKAVPNRGVEQSPDGGRVNHDQMVLALAYEQIVHQVAAKDESPLSSESTSLVGRPGGKIHHEVGMWLQLDNSTVKPRIARMATIPHGNSVLALGSGARHSGAPRIPEINFMPIGADDEESESYVQPYNFFGGGPFQGLFDVSSPKAQLEAANRGVEIVRTTALHVDSRHETGGVLNIPFITQQANTTFMESTFWIQEVKNPIPILGGRKRKPIFRLQYLQLVMLEFLPRRDGRPGLIQWPHISVNTLEKVSEEKPTAPPPAPGRLIVR